MKLPFKKIAINPINFSKPITCNRCGGSSVPSAVASSKILDDLTNKLIGQVWNKKKTIGTEGQLIVAEALELVGGLKHGYGVTVGYNTPDTLAMQLMEYNLFEFSESKTEARLAAMTDLLIDQDKNGIRPYADFEKLANEKVKDLNQNYLTTEYNLSVAVGQSSADYHRAMAQKDDFPWVKYETVGDEKVRNAHKKLDGKFLNLNDKEAMKLWPPNGYWCRCKILRSNRSNPPAHKVMTGDEAQKELIAHDDKWATGQFNINRGDLKQVFTKKQFYSDIKGLPKKLNEMTFDKYNLQQWDAFKQDLNPVKLDKSIIERNAKELFKPMKNENFMGFEDYFDRKLIMSEKVFDKHIKGKYLNKQENRHQLFPHIKDVLNNPDEVWYNNPDNLDGKFQSRYIKFYQDLVLIVDCKITGNGLEILTWYQAKKEDLYFRKGLLVRNKIN
jgi:SPP1 gp7 family putative phage head morphogenesis protein